MGPRGGAFLSVKNFEPPWEQYVRVALIPIATHGDYFVAVSQEGGGPDRFCWELCHRKTLMGVKMRVQRLPHSRGCGIGRKSRVG